MRWLVCTLMWLAFVPSALAADLDALRGSLPVGYPGYTNWTGFYAGGEVGYSDGNADFSGATGPLIAYSLRELALQNYDYPSQWPVLGKTGADAVNYGGFIGYNTQWQDLILSLEGDYTRSPLTVTATSSPLSRIVTAGTNTYSVNITGAGTLQLKDYASLRARAGWVVGNFLPYGFAGLVVGRANYSVSTLVYGQQDPATPPVVPCDTVTDPSCVDYSFSNSAAQNNAFLYGFSVGGGLDFALTQNIFLRGEFEYIRFAPIADIVVSIASARVGAGIKF